MAAGGATLELAAREANIVGLAPRILSGQRADPASITWAATEEKIDWVREAAGDRFDDLEFNVYPSAWPIVGHRRPARRGPQGHRPDAGADRRWS